MAAGRAESNSGQNVIKFFWRNRCKIETIDGKLYLVGLPQVTKKRSRAAGFASELT